MYEKHFGLSKRPFCDNVSGPDVFVGPQAAAAIAGLKKALARPDAVVTVSGPAGSGKTTLVGKALTTLGPACRPVAIGRMRLNDSDVLEYLLEALGVNKPPSGSARRFAAFRKVLATIQAENMRVAVIVEDAARTGVGTLAELEALTAADGGLSDGANLVLMGNESLGSILRDSQLERLAQRQRHRIAVGPMSTAEMRGYLTHTFRRAGGDFGTLFDGDSVVLLNQLSGGVPRMINNFAEAALSAAAAVGNRQIDAEFLAAVAHEEFGLDAELPAAKRPEPEFGTRSGPLTEPAPLPEPEPEPEPEPVIVFSDEMPGGSTHDEDSGEDKSVADESVPTLEVEHEPASALAPQGTATESSADSATEWARDPTLAELRPDLDALEAALADSPAATGDSGDNEDEVVVPMPEPEPEIIPEITLDNAIQRRIDNNLIGGPGQISPTGEGSAAGSANTADIPQIRLAPRETKKADAELERIAAELAKAKTIEDVGDKLAETLFGGEVSLIAAQVVTTRPSDECANDEELKLHDTSAAQQAQAAGLLPGTENPAAEASVEVSLETPEPGPDVPATDRHTPEPIEDQINTSMTQTLKALDVCPPVLNDQRHDLDDEEPDDRKGGFFGRFRR